MMFCDEAGQVSIAELCVPLTTFTNWEGLVLVGDSLQLEPTITSRAFNEFIMNAWLSPLALLQGRGVPTILLDEQYRMAPALSAFPQTQFYDEKGLKDSQKVKNDKVVRQSIRVYTIGLGVKGHRSMGTEYLVVNIPYGCSRQEPNGNSLVNHANALVAIDTIQRLLMHGPITPNMFKVLCYYKGQVRLISRLIREKPDWDEATKKAIVVTTVDSFQGKEGQIIILDTVLARDVLVSDVVKLKTKKRVGEAKGKKPATGEPDNDSDDDFGQESIVREGYVSKHVRNPNRLNVGLTRGIDGTIVLCQTGLLHATLKSNRGKKYNCLANMVTDADNRTCVANDSQLDMHPDAVNYRQSARTANLDQAARDHERETLEFIKRGKQFWKMNSKQERASIFTKTDVYHTSNGPTTRPIGNPALAAQADQHDREIARQNKLQEEADQRKKSQEEADRQLARAMHNSLEYPPLPKAAEVDKMDTTGDSQVELPNDPHGSGAGDTEDTEDTDDDGGFLKNNLVVSGGKGDDSDAESHKGDNDFDMV